MLNQTLHFQATEALIPSRTEQAGACLPTEQGCAPDIPEDSPTNGSAARVATPTASFADHSYLKTQLVYDHAPELATISPYLRALWARQHRWIAADIARYKPTSKVRFLDVGCGPGHMADSHVEHIELYVGVDPSMIELDRANHPGRILVHGMAEQLDCLAPNSFDVVTLISVLDHCIDWTLALRNCSDALRPGGIIVIVMENADQLPSRVRRALGREVEHNDHMHFIGLPEVDAALRGGFEVLQSRTFGYGFGLATLTTKSGLPRVIFDALIPPMDWVGRLLMRGAGQVLYGCYRKAADSAAQHSERVFRTAAPVRRGAIHDFLPGAD